MHGGKMEAVIFRHEFCMALLPHPAPGDESVTSSRNFTRHPIDAVRGQYLS